MLYDRVKPLMLEGIAEVLLESSVQDCHVLGAHRGESPNPVSEVSLLLSSAHPPGPRPPLRLS